MSDIACCPLSSGDCDGPSVFKKSLRKARRLHSCQECGETITIGESHEYVTGCWDGNWDSMRTCLPCVAVRDHFACEGFVYGHVWSDIITNFFPTMVAGGKCLEGMRPEGKAKMFDEFTHWYQHEEGYKERLWWQEQEERADDIKEARRAAL